MFQELMPLLAHRVLVLTLSRVSDEEICLNLIPRPLKPGEKDENSALTTPLSLIGTPKELDQDLVRQLVEFVDSHLELSSTLQSAKAEMAAAAKSAKEMTKTSAASKPSSTSARPTPAATAAADDTNPSVTPLNVDPAATTGSLFEAVPKTEG